MIKHAGSVIIQAASISNAVRESRAESTKPQPMTEDVFACVVLTGSPRQVDKKRLILPAISAHTPCFKFNLTIFLPTVRIILPPPSAVPMPLSANRAALSIRKYKNLCRLVSRGALQAYCNKKDTDKFLTVLCAVHERHEHRA